MRHLLAAALAIAFSISADAGPLTPPGAPSPTHKTLTEVEPRIPVNATNTPPSGLATRVITNPGSYYLTEDLVSPARGIAILSGGVTLDLNGFSITDDAVGTASDFGIAVLTGDTLGDNNSPVRIINGSIEDFTGPGIITSNTWDEVILQDVSVINCLTGFELAGPSTLQDCLARNNIDNGFENSFDHVRYTRCDATDNGAAGFAVGDNTQLLECIATSNGTGGVTDNGPGNNVILDACIINDNTGHGVELGSGVTISKSNISGNTLDGARVLLGTTITQSTFHDNNNSGINAHSGLTLSSSTFFSNTTGLTVLHSSTIKDCNFSSNDDGIIARVNANGFAEGMLRVSECSFNNNGQTAITAEEHCYITDNEFTFNGQLGGPDNGAILIYGKGSRIDSNSFSSNSGFAIILKSNRNIVVRNNFILNSLNIDDPTADNKITPILGDPTLMGPWDNFGH